MNTSSHPGQNLAHLDSQSNFLFSFVSVAYGIVVTSVFAALYGTLRDLRYQIDSLPPFEFGVTSKSYAVSLAPYVDAAGLALIFAVTWIAYYWLIAGLKTFSAVEYGLRALAFDLINAIFLFFALESLQNLGHKLALEHDTTWIFLAICLLLLALRFFFGIHSLQVPLDFRQQLRMERWLSAFFSVSYIALGGVGLAYLGFRYDRGSLEINRVSDVLWSSQLVFAVALLYPCWQLMRLRKVAQQDELHKDLWLSVAERELFRILSFSAVSVAVAILVWFAGDAVFDLLLRYRDAIPWSILLVILVAFSITVWFLGSPSSPARVLARGFGPDADIAGLCTTAEAFLSQRLGCDVTVVHVARSASGSLDLIRSKRVVSRKDNALQRDASEALFGQLAKSPSHPVDTLVGRQVGSTFEFVPLKEQVVHATGSSRVALAGAVRFGGTARTPDAALLALVADRNIDLLLQAPNVAVFTTIRRSLARIHSERNTPTGASNRTEASTPAA